MTTRLPVRRRRKPPSARTFTQIGFLVLIVVGVFVVRGNAERWEEYVPGVFVGREGGDYVCFIHCVDNSLFRARDPDRAFKWTGTDLFDALTFRELFGSEPDEKRYPIVAAVREHAGGGRFGRSAKPLLFVPIDRNEFYYCRNRRPTTKSWARWK